MVLEIAFILHVINVQLRQEKMKKLLLDLFALI